MASDPRRWRGRALWTALAIVIAVVLPQNLGLSSGWTVPFAMRGAFGVVMALAIAGVGWLGATRAAPMVFAVVVVQMSIAPTVSFGHFLALAAASYAAGRLSRPRHALVGLALSVLTTVAVAVAVDDPEFEVVFPLFVFSTAWVLGRVVQAHNARADTLRDLAEQLDRQQDELTVLAALEERQRIAGEMHDVLANSLSSIVVQAAAATEIARDRPDVVTALRNIEEVGRSGLMDVRSLLRGLDEHTVDGAAPGLGDIDALVHRMRTAGLDVTVTVDEHAKDVPASVSLNAYRIVQEALTNALRHAGSVATSVAVERERDRLTITVTNALPTTVSSELASAGSGRGLTGMKQRAVMHRGSLEAGVGRDGSYVVRAVLRLETA